MARRGSFALFLAKWHERMTVASAEKHNLLSAGLIQLLTALDALLMFNGMRLWIADEHGKRHTLSAWTRYMMSFQSDLNHRFTWPRELEKPQMMELPARVGAGDYAVTHEAVNRMIPHVTALLDEGLRLVGAGVWIEYQGTHYTPTQLAEITVDDQTGIGVGSGL